MLRLTGIVAHIAVMEAEEIESLASLSQMHDPCLGWLELQAQLVQELLRDGRAREIVHAVQNARKSAGLQVEDRIVLALGGDDELLAAAGAHREHLARETLAVEFSLDGVNAQLTANGGYSEESEIDGLPISIALRGAG